MFISHECAELTSEGFGVSGGWIVVYVSPENKVSYCIWLVPGTFD